MKYYSNLKKNLYLKIEYIPVMAKLNVYCSQRWRLGVHTNLWKSL